MTMATRTEAIMAAVSRTLASQAASIDANGSLATLTLVIQLGRGAGPDSCVVLCRQEAREQQAARGRH